MADAARAMVQVAEPEEDYDFRYAIASTNRAGRPERVFVASRALKGSTLPPQPVPIIDLKTPYFQERKKQFDEKGAESRLPLSDVENADLVDRADLL